MPSTVDTTKSKATAINIRPLHRIVGTILLLFTLYIGVTGLMIQSVDLRAILTHAAATDPEMMAIRESIDGTGNFAVIQPADYAAAALPDGYDLNAAVSKAVAAAHSSVGAGTPLKYVEVRVINGKPIGIVQAGDNRNATGNRNADGSVRANNNAGGNNNGGNGGRTANILRFDLATGSLLPNPPPRPRGGNPPSQHGLFKKWHRAQFISGSIGDVEEVLNALVGICLGVMIVTGLVLYFQLLRTRRRAGLNAIFWSAGGWWRSLHRGVSVVAAVFLLVVAISGTLLSFDTFALGVYGATHSGAGSRFPPGMTADLSSPLPDSKLPAMLATTLSAYHASEGNTPIKVLRLRYFSGMPQGAILTGGSGETRQLVYNAETGAVAHMTEPGYPYTGFPFGWREHEYMKQIHRGDALGLPGRLMDIFAGLALVFLSASGLSMYMDLLRRRRRGGHTQLFWS
jgi:uncharacterized iron-regulated membrane protein